ncbi:thiamine-phosphate pyrophosphorylase [Nocardioides marinisabuli]|uniref:Thiamine-phosphate synthase n=1 Tax=Nocardioides marinisabuli TaxID=419476 RepID=A0A7Y9F361_9ACTN|nr:thiamine phosphate synthase [Nocardioides marinisabuli]NYD57875.1 thiamine-phosphate pyrophosphorylase [Nocardioides marinisabuli]
MLPRLFCLVGPTDDLSVLPDLARLGVRGFQVRAKHWSTRVDDRMALRLARDVVAAVRPHGATVVVDDRLDVALAAGADGVHLGALDLPVADARRLAPGLLVGATCRDADDVRRATQDGADYAGFGPVFDTLSKPGLPAPLGLDAISAATGDLPLLAIGGMDAPRAREARSAGAHGVAVIGALWRQPDPLLAARELLDAVA